MIGTKTFSFENATISSKSFKKDGVLIVPSFPEEDLQPIFVPNGKSVPFFVSVSGGVPSERFDHEELQSIIDSCPGILDLWKELRDADIISNEFWTWDLLDNDSGVVINLSQVDAYYDNALEVTVSDLSVFNDVIQIAAEQNFVLSKAMYDKYMEVARKSKQELFDLIQEICGNAVYAQEVEKVL